MRSIEIGQGNQTITVVNRINGPLYLEYKILYDSEGLPTGKNERKPEAFFHFPLPEMVRRLHCLLLNQWNLGIIERKDSQNSLDWIEAKYGGKVTNLKNEKKWYLAYEWNDKEGMLVLSENLGCCRLLRITSYKQLTKACGGVLDLIELFGY